MFKKIAILFGLVLFSTAAFGAFNPANVPSVSTIADLQALGSSSPQYTTVYVKNYSAISDQGGGTFIWSPASTTTANGGTIFQANGVTTGRWIRQVGSTGGKFSAAWFGAQCDGTTNDSSAFQSAETAAAAATTGVIYPNGICVLNTTITMGIGVDHIGAGRNNTTILFNGSGWAFQLLLPNGTNIVNAPNFYDMAIVTLTGVGGIKYNDPTHGFTNDASSQEYMWKPIVDNVEFSSPSDLSGSIAIQCSKCFNAYFNNNYVSGFTIAIDMEGSDTSKITNNAIVNPGQYGIKAIAHSSFGNELVIAGNDMPGVNPAGTGFIWDGYNSSWIFNNHIEQTSGTLSFTIYLDATTAGAPIAGVYQNDVNVSTSIVSSWLAVTGQYQEIYAVNNINRAGNAPSPAIFNSGAGAQYWYNNISQQIINYSGNLAGNTGFPFNTVSPNVSTPPAPIPRTGGIFWSFTPNNPGMVNTGPGLTTNVVTDAFVLPVNGTPQKVSFTPQFHGLTSVPTGMDVYVCGWSSNGTTLVSINDGNTTVTQVLNTGNLCYLTHSNVNIPANLVQAWNADTVNNGTVYVSEIRLVYH